MKAILNFISEWIWQLPQNLCGLVYKYISNNNRKEKLENTAINKLKIEAYVKTSPGSVSLGKYIFISERNKNSRNTIYHECGHCKQSRILGPLYLIIIGIPSIIWATLHSYIPYFWKYSYYVFPTEKWADKLMHVKRK
jgi:hypothetical protein